MWPSSSDPGALNQRRDAYVHGIRKVCADLTVGMPDDVDGILGRARTLFEGQEDQLRRLEDLDLDASAADPNEVARTLLRAQQLPRMVLAMGEVLVQQEEDERLRPLQRRALDLGTELARITREWILAHGEDLDLLEEL